MQGAKKKTMLARCAVALHHSSSLSSSMATSPSLSSSSSSSRVRLCPRASAPASFIGSSAGAAGFEGRPPVAAREVAAPGGGALKMLCCNSVCSTSTAPVPVGALKVPSSLEMKCDLPLAYWIF